MVSVTSSEGTVMVISQPDKRFWDEDLGNVSVEELKPALREMLVTAMGDKYIDLVEYYAAQAAQDNKQELREMYTEFLGDSYFVCPMKYFSQKHSGKGNSVYSFVFGHRSVKSTLPEWSGVPHLADVPYYFGVPLWDYESYSDEDRNVSQEVMKAFSSFARYGTPMLDGVNWTRHTPWNPAVLWLQPGNYSMQYDIGDKNCGFWKQFME
ncbi:unnamed protein product [Ixodes persulcatus]